MTTIKYLTLFLGFDAIILYENADKSGANYIVTSTMEVERHWIDRISAVTITGILFNFLCLFLM